jgi:choline-sulfatase
LSGLLTDLAIEYAKRLTKESASFLMSLHYRSPHHPWTPVVEEDAAPYRDIEIELPHPDCPNLEVNAPGA